MKKYIFILLAALTFVACSEDEGNEVISNISEISKDEIPLDVKEFFSDYVSRDYQAHQGITFNFDKHNSCKAINSMTELSNIYSGERELPKINFGKYTLILGDLLTSHTGHYFTKLDMKAYEGHYMLNVYIEVLDHGYTAIKAVPFWGLYPKLKHQEIRITPLSQDGKVLKLVDSE